MEKAEEVWENGEKYEEKVKRERKLPGRELNRTRKSSRLVSINNDSSELVKQTDHVGPVCIPVFREVDLRIARCA